MHATFEFLWRFYGMALLVAVIANIVFGASSVQFFTSWTLIVHGLCVVSQHPYLLYPAVQLTTFTAVLSTAIFISGSDLWQLQSDENKNMLLMTYNFAIHYLPLVILVVYTYNTTFSYTRPERVWLKTVPTPFLILIYTNLYDIQTVYETHISMALVWSLGMLSLIASSLFIRQVTATIA